MNRLRKRPGAPLGTTARPRTTGTVAATGTTFGARTGTLAANAGTRGSR